MIWLWTALTLFAALITGVVTGVLLAGGFRWLLALQYGVTCGVLVGLVLWAIATVLDALCRYGAEL